MGGNDSISKIPSTFSTNVLDTTGRRKYNLQIEA